MTSCIFATLLLNMYTQITRKIDESLLPVDALYVKKIWAAVQLDEMRTQNDWAIAQTALEVANLADPFGVGK